LITLGTLQRSPPLRLDCVDRVLICLAGCAAFALAIDLMKGLRAARNSAVIGVATLIFGVFLFPVHDASGALYIYLLIVTFGASLIFVLVASGCWIW
jgi:hypothetical protein